MHDPPFGQGQGQLLWLFSGTGEGPPLARACLAQGWRLEVFVVTASAARAYPPAEGLGIRVGPVGDRQALLALLQAAEDQARAPRWVVDATHPFATRISADLAQACAQRRQPLLRLLRPAVPLEDAAGITVVPDWQAVAATVPSGERVLLAIGARRLPLALAALPGRDLHARVLPTASSLAMALAAGLPSARLAVLRPSSADREVLAALCRQWTIGTVVARASGGSTEQLWRELQADLGLKLVVLRRPPQALPGLEMPLPEFLRRLSPDGEPPDRQGIAGVWGPAG